MQPHQPYTSLEGNTLGQSGSSAAPAVNIDIVRSVRLRPMLAAGVAAAVFLLVVGYALTRRPMYLAQSLTYVEPLAVKVVSDGSEGTYDGTRYDSYLQQQIQTAQRPDILVSAVTSLPPGTWQMQGESVQEAAERLGAALKVARVGTSYQLSIGLLGSNPEATAAVVNAATNAYLAQGRKDEHTRSDGRIQLLTEERDRIQKELAQDRTEQNALSARLGVADSAPGAGNPYDEQLTGLRSELVAARQAHDVAAAQLASVSGTQSNGLNSVADEAIAGDAGLGTLKSSVNSRRAALSSQMSGLTASNPIYKQDQDEIAHLDHEVEARTALVRQTAARHVQDKLRLDLQRTGDIEARLNGQLARATAAASGAAPRLQRAAELSADITRLQTRYASVDDALRGLQLETNGPGTAHLSVAATVPTSPEANRRGLMLLMAVPMALLAGIAAAVIAKKRDPRVYTTGDVESALGVPPLVSMPPLYELSGEVREEYLLRLATGLERAYRMNAARSFVFTAASAEMEISAFVDSIKDKLMQLGFKAMVMDAGQVWRMDTQQRHARDGFAATRMELLKKENNFILIDAQPLLHSADAEYVASAADATFLIVDSSVTTGDELKRAMMVLRRLRANGVGTILQNVELKNAEEKLRFPIEIVERKRVIKTGAEEAELAAVAQVAEERRERARQEVRLDEAIASAHEIVRAPLQDDARASVVAVEAVPAATVEIAERRQVQFLERAVEPTVAEPGVAAVAAGRFEAARLAAARLEAGRVEAERVAVTRVEAERVEAERVEVARVEAERAESERLEAARLEAERAEAARLEAARVEAERVEAERVVAMRVAAERVEAARLEAERVAAERLEAGRVEAERLKAARLEAARLEAARLKAEMPAVGVSKTVSTESSFASGPVKVETISSPRMMFWEASIKSGARIAARPASVTHQRSAMAVAVEASSAAGESEKISVVREPVRSVMSAAPVIPWAPRVERRQVPRLESSRPFGLPNRRDHGVPRLTAAEQAVARSSEASARSAREVAAPVVVEAAQIVEAPVAVAPVAVTPVAVTPRRWGLLSRLDEKFEDARVLSDEAAS